MSTVDIDKELVLLVQNTPAEFQIYTILSEEIVKRVKPVLTAHLKAELLAKMPPEKTKPVNSYTKWFNKGYNQAIAEITKIVEEL